MGLEIKPAVINRGSIQNVANVDKNFSVGDSLMLHPAEIKLLQTIRSIEFGEIEGLKVEGGIPVSYKGARKTCKIV